MLKKTIFVLSWVCCVTGVNCYGTVDSYATNKAFTADGNDVKEAAVGNTDFAFDLYGKLKGDPNVYKIIFQVDKE